MKRRAQNKHEQRQLRGEEQLLQDANRKSFQNDWNLGWFTPKGSQISIVESIDKNTFTVVDGPSGSGKTSTAIWKALNDVKNRKYNQLIFIKNPTETGDDKIGFLSGNESDKLQAHYETTKNIFENFISKEKLECDIPKRIRLAIPNFILGATFDHSIVIIDESQVMSPTTMKLLLERCGIDTHYVILGDSQQRYAIAKREDGLRNLIERITIKHQGIRIPKYPEMFGYIKMTPEDNQRSAGSRFINKLYDDF